MGNTDGQSSFPPTGAMSLAVAVGVSSTQETLMPPDDRKWFVAFVMHNTEQSCRRRLLSDFADSSFASDFEPYVASQRELHVWRNGRRKMVDRILFPSYLFIHCTESVRKTIKEYAPYIRGFMKDPSRERNIFGASPFAFIPDYQMDSLRRMAADADGPVTIDPKQLRVGRRVLVRGGKLNGFEGNVFREPGGKTYVTISLDFLGYAKVEIPFEQLEII